MGALTVTVSRPVADDEDERLRLAGSTGTPPHVLARLATDAGTDSTTIRTAVAQNPNTPRATLTVLASDTRPLTRVRVAANRNTPTSVLRQLAEDSNIHVRIVIARNPNTPAGILDALSRSDDLDIASSVAGHANASAATIERLSYHDDIAIRALTVRHPRIRRRRLRELEHEPHPVLAKLAVRALVCRALPHQPETVAVIADELLPTWPGTAAQLLLTARQISRARPGQPVTDTSGPFPATG